MNNMIIVGSKRNGYLINLEEKSLTINYFNSLYENLRTFSLEIIL